MKKNAPPIAFFGFGPDSNMMLLVVPLTPPLVMKFIVVAAVPRVLPLKMSCWMPEPP